MRFPNSVFRINILRLFLLPLILSLLLFQSGCSVTEIQHKIPPSPKALSGINELYIKNFKGEQSVLFGTILIHEINQLPEIKYLAVFPDNEKKEAALISAEVLRYSVKDEEEVQQQTHISLVEKEVLKENPTGLNVISRTFEFVEKPYTERSIHRTLDLGIAFKITNIAGDKTLYINEENASLKQSYVGEESIMLIPETIDEMVRLAQLLIQKFLYRINPEPTERIVVLEKGSQPVPWTMGFLDFGHPQIMRSNHYATGGRYDLALKGWNYVLFEPRTYPESESFIFTDNVYTRLKKANLPDSTLRPLLEIHGKTFSSEEIDVVLMGLISNQDFERYSQIIKAHSRSTQQIDRLNLAAAHFNIGAVYHLRNELELAAYHFAQANAYNPDEKYALAWNDIQHILGKYNPFDALNERNVESAGKLPPPDGALLQPASLKTP